MATETAVTVIEQPEPSIAAIWQAVIARRFWPRVDTSAGAFGCWPWTGGHDRKGYGMFCQGRRGAQTRAHRFSLELALGRPLRPGMGSCHTCDNPPCVNPLHLYEGTQRDNLRDAAAKGRTALQRHPERAARGERNAGSKLTADQVVSLRVAARGLPMREVAGLFGISLSQAYRVATGHNWSEIPMETSHA